MLDKRTSEVLQILFEQAKDGYTVLEKQSLLERMPQKLRLDKDTFCSILSFLKQQEYIDVKYQDKDTVCLAVTAKTRNHLDGLGDTKGAELANNQFWRLLLCVGACAFVGAFLAVMVAEWIF